MRVVVAMSGGVDSSAAAALLVEQGHEVIGITLRVWSYEGAARCGSCCSPDDIDDARAVAQALGIPFYVANAEELFKEQVVRPFIGSYLSGKTPIPCVACNQRIKFDFLLRRARSLGAKLATGHYARVVEEAGRRHLYRGIDPGKDQSYFLFTLGQAELCDLIFPVGDLTKEKVREIAARHRLPTAQKPESMEICFVPDGDYASFVEKVAGTQEGGEIVDGEGKILGRHQGIHRFTIGQRRGLKVASPQPMYVQRIDPAERKVVVGPASQSGRTSFDVERTRWVEGAPPQGRLQVQVRHRHAGAWATLAHLTEDRWTVMLNEPVRAVAPGQAAVFYDGERLLGGGWIS